MCFAHALVQSRRDVFLLDKLLGLVQQGVGEMQHPPPFATDIACAFSL